MEFNLSYWAYAPFIRDVDGLTIPCSFAYAAKGLSLLQLLKNDILLVVIDSPQKDTFSNLGYRFILLFLCKFQFPPNISHSARLIVCMSALRNIYYKFHVTLVFVNDVVSSLNELLTAICDCDFILEYPSPYICRF